ncbi:MAG TPA: alpha/beta hydrolase [Caulobacteraceae bacterium]|jgi:acetyl esterase/lipase|nr:alpha/beta hydrolase [Caulobacteraceae bacterium]
MSHPTLFARLALGGCVAALVLGGASAQAPGPGGPGGPPAAPAAPDPATFPHRDYPGGVVGLQDITFATNRGFRPLKLDLYLPANRQPPKALVLWIHGGGWSQGDPRGGGIQAPAYRDWPKVLASLAGRGYVVAGISYRLSGEARFPAAIFDVKAAVRWLRANAATYGIDPARVVVWGGSAGGQLAALLGTSCNVVELEGTPVRGAQASSCVQGVVDFYGPTDFRQMDAQRLPNTDSASHDAPTSGESVYLGCPLPQCPPEQLRLANPIAFVDRTDPPFLIMHGDADTAVPPKQSQILYDALKAAGVKAELLYVPGVNHIFAGATDAQGAMILDKVFAFLDATTGTTR